MDAAAAYGGAASARKPWLGRCARRLPVAVVASLSALVFLDGYVGGRARPRIRVDVASFWYERLSYSDRAEPWEPPAAPRGSSLRVRSAVEDLLATHALDFLQPPPLEIVVRAQPREELASLAGYLANRTSYGGTERRGQTVYVNVHQAVFSGPDALNDAELRAFLGHELRHAYQCVEKEGALSRHEVLQREIDAYEWELAHLLPGVRSAYREDVSAQLRMHREMLGD